MWTDRFDLFERHDSFSISVHIDDQKLEIEMKSGMIIKNGDERNDIGRNKEASSPRMCENI
jgi:hypothetical protein